MAKFKFNLRDASSEAETAIHLIIRWNNNRLVFPTGLSIKPKFWETDKKKSNFQRAKIIKQFPTHPEFNTSLDNKMNAAKNVFRRYENDKKHSPTVEALRDLLNQEIGGKESKELSLFSFIEKFIEDAKIKTNEHTGRTFSNGTIKTYRNTFSNLKEFAKVKRRKIDFSTIDLDFYQDFVEYLIKVKKFSTNTVGRSVKNLKVFLNAATELGINTNMAYKSKRFRAISEEVDNIYLTEEELASIHELDLSDNLKLDRVRDTFLLGCYTGLRFSDFSKICQENIKGDFLHITTQKTAEKVVIPFHPVVSSIIKKYKGDLPEVISNQKMNDYLKEMAKKVDSLRTSKVSLSRTKGGTTVIVTCPKSDLVTSHTARRSFATNAYLQNVPSFVIMGITGHRTERAFLKYIKITSSEKAKMLQLHWQGQTKLKVV